MAQPRRIQSHGGGGHPGATRRFNGAAETAGGGPLLHGKLRIERDRRQNRRKRGVNRKVGLGLWASEVTSSVIVCSSSILGGIKRTEPDSSLLDRIPDLGSKSSPRPLSNSSKSYLLRPIRSDRGWARSRKQNFKLKIIKANLNTNKPGFQKARFYEGASVHSGFHSR